MYKYILLDLDETIWDFKKAETLAFEQTLNSFAIPYGKEIAEFYSQTNLSLWKALERKEITKDELKSLRFELTYQKAKELYPDVQLPEATGLAINDCYMKYLSQYGIMLDGADDFLKKLDNLRQIKNIKVYFITNGIIQTVSGRVNNSQVDRYCNDIFISGEIGVEKPDINYFNYVTNAVNDSDTANYLVVGDSLTSDIQGAINSNMDSCLFAFSGDFPEGFENYKITYKATSYHELYQIIDNNT